MSEQNNPTTDGTTAATRTTAIDEVGCGYCGTDVTRTGFILETTSYQSFDRVKDVLVRSYVRKSRVKRVVCTMCRQSLAVDAKAIVERSRIAA